MQSKKNAEKYEDFIKEAVEKFNTLNDNPLVIVCTKHKEKLLADRSYGELCNYIKAPVYFSDISESERIVNFDQMMVNMPDAESIAIPRDMAKRTLEHLSDLHDEGPPHETWQSEQLVLDIETIKVLLSG